MPFAGMMLADHGAELIRIERPGVVDAIGPAGDPRRDELLRSRTIVTADLKEKDDVVQLKELAAGADGLIEGYRPGVMERLGLGPEPLLEINPALVYGRMTGWGQSGPCAHMAGHDINFIALSGALHMCGRRGEKPIAPANLIGDFGGGGMMLAFGMVSAILHARRTGEGQIVDCAMTDGSALLTSMLRSFWDQDLWQDERGVNSIDGGAHFYDSYETSDGGYIALGAIEPRFYSILRERMGLDDPEFDRQADPAHWPSLSGKIAARVRTRSRAEWCALLDGTDACFAPVLSLAEAPAHPHNITRATFVEAGGVVQAAPAPRYSRRIQQGAVSIVRAEDRQL